jgi:hypothetical protein
MSPAPTPQRLRVATRVTGRWARPVALGLLVLAVVTAAAACRGGGPPAPKHRERDASRDAQCKDPQKPRAYFYPAENRTDYRPDHPQRDRCELLVADHLFCCPDEPRPSDR